jgi:hypothetical protein
VAKRHTVYVCNWPEGVIPRAIDDLLPLDSIEMKKALGTYTEGNTESDYPCPTCGYSIFGFSMTSRCGSHFPKTESCKYCSFHHFTHGSVKIIDGECSVCGPTKIARNGGKFPRWKVTLTVSNRGGVDERRQVVYDLDVKLPGPES